MILPLPAAIPTRPFTCTNTGCPHILWLGKPKTYARLTPRALDRAQTFGKACGWCSHTTTQKRTTQ